MHHLSYLLLGETAPLIDYYKDKEILSFPGPRPVFQGEEGKIKPARKESRNRLLIMAMIFKKY